MIRFAPALSLRAVALAGLAFASLPSSAHIGYTGRDFGSFSGTSTQTVTIANQAVSGNYGWADAADYNYGDSHKARAFRFTLDRAASVTFSVAANAGATSTSIDGLLPGFGLYEGLAHLAPHSADHDGAAITTAYLATLPGEAKEGAWVSTGDFQIGNDGNAAHAAALSSFVFKGYAVDGTAANFSNANPSVVGDGVADGQVSGSFLLAAGTYSIFVGGADYWAQSPVNPNLDRAYGMSATLSVSAVPEAETWALMLLGLVAVGTRTRHRALPR